MKFYITALMLCFVASGCILVPIYDGVRQMGITESDRVRLLDKDVGKYGDALVWGNRSEALAFIDPKDEKLKTQLTSDLKNLGDKLRVVETKIENVEFKEEAMKAEVDMKLRYFEIPYYTVKDRVEKQDWAFDRSAGWRLKSRNPS